MKHTLTRPALPLTMLAAGLALLAPGAARATAPTSYKMQLIAQAGDQLGGLPAARGFQPGALNDRGQLVFGVGSGTGQALVEYDGGSFRVIAAPGEGWPDNLTIDSPASMNQHGDIVFTATQDGAGLGLGTYLWSDQTQSLTVIAEKGMPAVRNLTFQSGGYWFPTINNQGEIAFDPTVDNAAGVAHSGTFLRTPDGQIQAVALPGDPLPDGSTVLKAGTPTINDAGSVAFVAVRSGDSNQSAFLWEKGTITPIALAGSDTPDGRKITAVNEVWVNSQNHSVLVALADAAADADNVEDLYLWNNGTLTPVAIPGQAMPGGGQLEGVPSQIGAVSTGNDAGQHALLALLQDGSTAAYRMEADGTLSLILKSGMPTSLGTVGHVQFSTIALNNSGQVALTLRITDGPPELVLLTPSAP